MKKVLAFVALAGLFAMPAAAQGTGLTAKQTEVMKQLLATYETKAKEQAQDKKSKSGPFKPFTAEAGREFYLKRRSWQLTDPTCSGCHTEDPKKEGKHIETKKPIKPLAPVANADRFVNIEKVEKNFADHCQDLLERDCYANEKGSYISYMMSVK